MEEQSTKKCSVYYKIGRLQNGDILFGERFDRLEACCATFEKLFLSTGNEKNSSWDVSHLLEEKPGLNLLKAEGKLGLFLHGYPIQFCPFCCSQVELQKSKEVLVTRKFCYEEKEIKGGDQ